MCKRIANRLFGNSRYKKVCLQWVVLLISYQLIFTTQSRAQSPPYFEHIGRQQGLSVSRVSCILRDSKGFMWFGTGVSLDRYDGYQFKNHHTDQSNPYALTHSAVSALYEDRNGLLWVGTEQGYLNRYTPEQNIFEAFPPKDQESPLVGQPIQAFCQDRQGAMWVGSGAGLFHLDRTGKRVMTMTRKVSVTALLKDESDFTLYIGTSTGLYTYDTRELATEQSMMLLAASEGKTINALFRAQNTLWVGANTGLSSYTPAGGWLEVKSGTSSSIEALSGDDEGILWLAVKDGIVRFDRAGDLSRGGSIHYQLNESKTLSQNQIKDIYVDPDGVLWVASWGGGINRLDRLPFYHKRLLPDSKKGSSVLALGKDTAGRIWVTGASGIHVLEAGQSGSFQQLLEVPAENLDQSNSVSDCYIAPDQTLWASTLAGLLHHDPKGTDRRYTVASHGLLNDRLGQLQATPSGVLWIGSESGLHRMELQEPGRFKTYQHQAGDPKTLPHNVVSSLFIDREQQLWVGTLGGGFGVLGADKGIFQNYHHDIDRPESLSSNYVLHIYQDHHNRIWVGTLGGGLNQMMQDGVFKHWRPGLGLPTDSVYAILDDTKGNLWLAGDQGLIRFNPQHETYRVFSVQNGIRDHEFNGAACVRASNGQLYFGGTDGVTAFHPDDFGIESPPQTVVITGLRINNQSVSYQHGRTSRLSQAIESLDDLELKPSERILSLEFSGLDYREPSQNTFRYQMAGLNEAWVKTGKNRVATFTDMPTGTYVFRAKVANRDGVWSEASKGLQIRVLGTPWLSWWALSLYIIAFLGALLSLFILHRRGLHRERVRVNKLKDLDKLKDDFLANTTSALRNPLNSIVDLSESLLDGAAGAVSLRQATQLTMIAANGRRLSSLVSDILDYSKLENQDMKLMLQNVDVHALTEVVFSLCGHLAVDKGLRLENKIPADTHRVRADEKRIKQVLYNLVSNGIKFTERGNISVSCQVQKEMLQLSVQDSGYGISEKKQQTLFESYEQMAGDKRRARTGAGLGLALARQLIVLHGGSINVTSKHGQGATFSFSLPLSDSDTQQASSLSALPLFEDNGETALRITQNITVSLPTHNSNTRFHILIVDDEPVNRQILINHLSQLRQRLTAVRDGPSALEVLDGEEKVNLVLLDIMMPGMSGYEVCKQIRRNHPVEDLPVILLSARHQIEDVLAGFESGANDCLTKPFPKQELLGRVKVHLHLQDTRSHLVRAHADLTQAMNQVQEKNSTLIKMQNKLIIQEKMATIGTLASGIVHELKNPANYTHICAQTLEEELEKFKQYLFALAGDDADREVVEALEDRMKPLDELVKTVLNGSERLKEIAVNLSGFSRMGRGEKRFAAVSDCLNSTITLVKAKYKNMVQFHVELEDPLETVCRPAELSQLFMNLMVNACQAIHQQESLKALRDKGNLWISIRKQGREGIVIFKDTGGGVPDVIKGRIFEAFFTSKPDGEGTGLGLSISKQIAEEHGGTLSLQTIEGEGSIFTFRLPLISEPGLLPEVEAAAIGDQGVAN